MIPFVTEAEEQAERVLAGIAAGWPDRAAQLELGEHQFADLRWRTVWSAARTMASQGRPVDPVTLVDELEGAGNRSLTQADVVGAFVAVPTADNAEHYAAIVRDGWIRRQVAQAAAGALEAAKRHEDGAEVLGELLRRLAEVHVEGAAETRPVREMLRERFLELGRLADAKGKGDVAATGIPTGLEGLDRLLGGFQRGIVTVAAGRPGMGKSAFGMAAVRHASGLGIGCHVFSLEDTREAYCDRVLSGESLVPAEKLRQVALARADLGALSWAIDRIPKERPWVVDDRSGITAEEVVRSVRRSLERNRTELVVVDYVQILKGPPRMTREEAVSHAMNVLADAAKQDRIAYLVLAQLNRDCERRDDKRPILADLKQAGTIEERAKCVVMLYRPSVYGDKDERGFAQPDDLVELLIRKNNQGRTGPAAARWDGATLRMH